jgi:MFS family permease
LLSRLGLGGLGREPLALFAIRTLNSTGFSISMPFFGIYLLEVRHVSLAATGAVYLAAGIVGLGSQLAGGRLTDRLGPKKVMLSGYAASVATSLTLGYMILGSSSLYLFYVAYPLFTFLRGVSNPATGSIIAEQPASKMRAGYNLLTIGGNVGFAIGPAIGGPVAEIFGYSDVFFLSALTVLPVIALALLLVGGGVRHSEPQERVRRSLSWKENGNLIAFLVLTGCLFVAVGYEITPMSLYVADFLKFSNIEIGYLFATNGLAIVLLQIPIINLVSRSSRLILPLLLSPILAAASFAMAGLSTSFLEYEAVMVVLTLGEILLTVPSQTIVALFSESGNRGTYQGYYYAASNTGRSIASGIGPTSFEILSFSPSLGWYAIGIFAMIVFLGFAVVGPKVERDYRQILEMRST